MKVHKKAIFAAFLLMACFVIRWYSSSENRVENGYSASFSPAFSRFLRICLGKIPISIGDILYGLLVAWLIVGLIRFCLKMFKKGKVPSRKQYFLNSCFKIFVFCCCMYIVFNIFWGINYDRKGIAWQLGLEMKKYTKQDLEEMNCMLVDKINSSKKALIEHKTGYPPGGKLYSMVNEAYKNVTDKYSFLNYSPASIKSSMWGWLGNYTGFTGYYNPFTGEAQLNTSVPKFLHPFIACHEVAHQLGYAKEMEANFVGFLAATASSDELFHYSVYLDMFTYANRNLFFMDSTAAKLCRKELDTAVIVDIKEWIKFNMAHQNPVEPVIRWVYGKYLESNSQPQGLLSYDEVTAFIISYYKKFGKI